MSVTTSDECRYCAGIDDDDAHMSMAQHYVTRGQERRRALFAREAKDSEILAKRKTREIVDALMRSMIAVAATIDVGRGDVTGVVVMAVRQHVDARHSAPRE